MTIDRDLLRDILVGIGILVRSDPPTSDDIINALPQNVGWETDGAGCLHIIKNTPQILLCAHLDRSPNGVGYDDSVGVSIALSVLDRVPDIGILLTVGEEEGGTGIQQAILDFDLTFYKACLVLDHCGPDPEIIYQIHGHELCDYRMAEQISAITNWDLNIGEYCDALFLSDVLPTVNISIGVTNQHSPYETFDAFQVYDTAQTVLQLIHHKDKWLP